MGFTFGFGAFGIMFFIVFFVILAVFVVTFIRGISQWGKNNNSPRLTTEVTVVAKRTHVRGDHAHTTYYATFEAETGDRMELLIPYNEFGYLVEGDRGKLTFQGTRYLGFERT